MYPIWTEAARDAKFVRIAALRNKVTSPAPIWNEVSCSLYAMTMKV